jgi:hypothetical protein
MHFVHAALIVKHINGTIDAGVDISGLERWMDRFLQVNQVVFVEALEARNFVCRLPNLFGSLPA